jgi:hypothetical protein
LIISCSGMQSTSKENSKSSNSTITSTVFTSHTMVIRQRKLANNPYSGELTLNVSAGKYIVATLFISRLQLDYEFETHRHSQDMRAEARLRVMSSLRRQSQFDHLAGNCRKIRFVETAGASQRTNLLITQIIWWAVGGSNARPPDLKFLNNTLSTCYKYKSYICEC